MKKLVSVLFFLALIFSACGNTSGNGGAGNIPVNLSQGQQNSSGEPGGANTSGGEDQSTPITNDATADCLSSDEHPIAESVADEYAHITNYDEVIGWFCDGALFEDILNALMTEELTEVDAGDVLLMVAEGKSWDEIWLELGITEE